uniref:Junctional cadherin 5 associated a n=1 Tax=Pygocentrus nattereri TaxID=42514 RepID=A0A3B4C3R6_PYGNA
MAVICNNMSCGYCWQDFSALLDYGDPRELAERPLARWEEGSWMREAIDSGPETLRVTGERKCQSLGTEEWRPAVGLGRQLSDGEAERWSQEQQHRLRPAESSVPATVRMKSQSLPRVLSPEDPQYRELPQAGAASQAPTQRNNSSVPYGRYHSEWPMGERWSGQSHGQGPVALVPKPRFSRPVKPPSYETHQQNRGNRSICYSQSAELLRPEAYRADLLYQELTGMEPPGYIPPPSYRRFPPPRGGQIFRADSALVRWKREPVSAEMGEWFSRTAGLSWSERREDRSMAVVPRRPVHPAPVVPNRPGHVQYVPFDDPRIRHISGGPSGNSLTDADKIRHVNKELPCCLPPYPGAEHGHSQTSSSESVSTAKTEPAQEPEKKSVKKKLSETIFCLVSVPLSQSSGNNTLGSLPNQSLKSTSTTSTDLELQALTLGSASSSIVTRRAHRRRNSRTRIIKPNPHDELRRYSGAWPGDQYRDQETQTSPELAKSAQHPGPDKMEAQTLPAVPEAEVPAERASGAAGATDPSTPYGYPMKGQKSLKPSSNSAFSRTGTFKSTAKSPPLDQAENAKSSAGPNPEAFGQFLLKPVTRRSWDAIEELESINKELQEQASKRPTVDQCIEDLNEAYKDILELSTASNNLTNRSSMQIPDRIKARLSSEPLGISATTLRPSLVPGSDPEYREVKSAFSRPSTGKSVSFSKQLREEICPAPPPPETGFRDYKTVMSQITHRKACRSVKLDLLTSKETPVKDDSLAALTSSTSSMGAEVPWADRQPMQDASTLTSPPDYEHICQTLQMARDSGAISRGASVKSKPGSAMSIDTPQHVAMPGVSAVDSEQPCSSLALDNEKQVRQEPVSLFREERSSGFRRVTSQSTKFLGNRGMLSSIATGKSVGDKAGLEANPEVPADWQIQLSLAEKHIATLITGEESKHGTADDIDEMSKVDREEGIPASELVEDQANKTVQEDSLVTCEERDAQIETQENEPTQGAECQLPIEIMNDGDNTKEKMQIDSEKTDQEDPMIKGKKVQEQTQEGDPGEPKKDSSVTLRPNKAAMWTHSGVDPGLLPEFPPDHLPLSVLSYPNRRLSLGLDWERSSWEGEMWNSGGGWARERRSLDAERQDLDGDRWALDGDRQQTSGEKRGLGGWRGCGIDRQGADDSDWDLDIGKRHTDTGDKEQSVDATKWNVEQTQDQSEDQSSTPSNKDLDANKHNTPDKGGVQGAEVGPGVKDVQASSLGRRGRGLSQRIEALHDRFMAPPGHGSEERLARMREVDTVSRMRRLSLRSTDSWDGLYGVSFVTRAEEVGRDDEQSLPSSQELPNAAEKVESESSEPGETQDNQPIATGTVFTRSSNCLRYLPTWL